MIDAPIAITSGIPSMAPENPSRQPSADQVTQALKRGWSPNYRPEAVLNNSSYFVQVKRRLPLEK